LNKTIFETSDEKTFVTFAYVLLNKSTARLALATAGHPPILVKNESSRVVTRHRCANVALGLKETVPFGQEEKGLASGDSILLYTDGILECTNADGEEFGQERLETAFSAAAGSPDDVCAQLVREARAFSGEQSFQDDVSIVCIKTL
jgi:sigma-B regulation protein RsbU (phosphoserine phosphatase)